MICVPLHRRARALTRPGTLGLLPGLLALALCAWCSPPAAALTYVSGSLTDSNPTNGNGISTPAGSTHIQYSDGSAGGSYGQIDIADDPADPDWVYDLGSTKAISSITFWSYGLTTAFSQMPSGTITLYRSSSSTGPWTQIGSVTRSMVRDTTPPNSQATAGEGFRVPCDGSSGRYIRVNAVTPGYTGGLDNHWVIRRVEENKNLVIHDFHRTSDGSSAINDWPRIPYNAVDGNSGTMWNPLATSINLTLDIGPTARRFQQIIFTPNSGDGSFLPQKGEVRVSSTDDPDNMDMVVGLFDIAWNTEATDNATIILPQPFTKRFVQVRWTSVRNVARTETRIAEVVVDSVSDKPTGTDITQGSIPTAYRVTPNDGVDDTAKLQAAINNYKYVYLPQGTYNITGDIYMPSDSRLYGYSDDTTILSLSTSNKTAIRVEGTDQVRLDHFRIDRTVGNATEAAIMVYKPGSGDIPFYTEIDWVKITNNRSRLGAILVYDAMVAGVTNCSIYESQDQIVDGGQNYIYGSGISALRCTWIYLAGNNISESRDLITSLPNPHPNNFYQAGGIETSSSKHAVVWDNVVERYGNGIDIGGSIYSLAEVNWVDNIHETGIKLVNGTADCTVRNNTIKKCGITGVWLSHGSAPTYAKVHHNLIDNNNLYEMGQGIGGSGYWANFGGFAPAGVCVDKAVSTALRCEYNTITNNDAYFNGSVKSPASTYAFYVHTGSVAPYMTTVSGNVVH